MCRHTIKNPEFLNVCVIQGEKMLYLRQQRELHDWQPKLGELHDEQLHDRYPEQQPRAE